MGKRESKNQKVSMFSSSKLSKKSKSKDFQIFLSKASKKRGAGHVEMIISFILFVSFVSFLLFYIRPYSTGAVLTDSIILSLHNSFEAKASTNLTKIFLKINPSKPVNCFYFSLSGIDVEGASLIKTAFGDNKVESSFLDGKISIDTSSVNGHDAFYIFISDEFKHGSLSCTPVVPITNYTIGSINKQVLISDKKLQDLKNQYEGDDYDSLKQEFGVPATIDFGIRSGDYIVLEEHIPEDIEVIAKVYTHSVLFEDGSVVNKEFIFKIW